jgi:hypothetical protein
LAGVRPWCHHESATLDAHLGKGPGAHNPVVVAWVTATIAAGGLLLANLLALGPALAASRLRPAQLLRTQ